MTRLVARRAPRDAKRACVRLDGPDGDRHRVVEAVRAGASLPEACAAVGVKVNTARGWLRKGRTDPEGRYAAFAFAVDGARASQRLPDTSARGALTRGELELLVAKTARAGSVPAMRLWVELHKGDQAPAARVDPFARFDELAKRRQARGDA